MLRAKFVTFSFKKPSIKLVHQSINSDGNDVTPMLTDVWVGEAPAAGGVRLPSTPGTHLYTIVAAPSYHIGSLNT